MESLYLDSHKNAPKDITNHRFSKLQKHFLIWNEQ